MNLLIIVFVFLSLLGSIMWVMPTKRDRFLAKLRLQARPLGFQVQLIKLTYPREMGEVEARVVSAVIYRLLRGTIAQDIHNTWNCWRVVKCTTNASDGLIKGWGWALGERTMNHEQLVHLNYILKNLPEGVYGLESTPVHVSAYWNERESEELQNVERTLQEMISKML